MTARLSRSLAWHREHWRGRGPNIEYGVAGGGRGRPRRCRLDRIGCWAFLTSLAAHRLLTVSLYALYARLGSALQGE